MLSSINRELMRHKMIYSQLVIDDIISMVPKSMRFAAAGKRLLLTRFEILSLALGVVGIVVEVIKFFKK